MSAAATLPRYIGYITLPGYCRAELCEYGSQHEAARDLAARAAAGPCGDDPYLDLYRVDGQEMLQTARDFEGVGIPFDHPDYRITLGTHGGAHIERA
jgi:hypothetical protein